MDQQQEQQLNQRLRQNWNQVRHQILDQFAQVSTADLDSAQTPQDLIQRIADKTHHSERFVETRLTELVGVGGGSSLSGQQYGQTGQQGNQQGERFGSSPQQ